MTDGGVFSPTWYRTFLATVPAAQTGVELQFVARQLPLPHFRRLLDLCCGYGRHAIPLAGLGYEVTGVDRNARVIAAARAAAPPGCRFLQQDIRDLAGLQAGWDGVLILWASFGWFTPAQNQAVLDAVYALLRPGGRLLLDVYHRDFFARHHDERRFTRDGIAVHERKQLTGDVLTVELQYAGSGDTDRFQWQVHTPESLAVAAHAAGLELVLACSDFTEVLAASAERPRMQLVLQKPAG